MLFFHFTENALLLVFIPGHKPRKTVIIPLCNMSVFEFAKTAIGSYHFNIRNNEKTKQHIVNIY
jgi:hypothetical protein